MIYKTRHVHAPFNLKDLNFIHILFVSTYGSIEALCDHCEQT